MSNATANTSSRRLAVIGAGHLGTIHSKLIGQLSDAELATIVEPNPTRAAEVAEQFGCEVETDFERFLNNTTVDGVVIAAPTSLHHSLGVRLLERGIHCLVEKPLAPTVSECADLVDVATRKKCVLQVGHVERFNPAWTAFCNEIQTYGSARAPRFFDATREGSLTFRSMDGGVVLDLMIHDIDLVLSLVKSPIVSVQANGFHWTGAAEDIAEARVSFANGAVARFSVSRVATEPRRTMRVCGRDWSGEIDFGSRNCTVVSGPTQKDWQTRSFSVEQRKHLIDSLYEQVLTKEELPIADANPILDELTDFVGAINENRSATVSGEAGMSAVDVAQQVLQRIATRANSRRTATYQPPRRKAG